MWQQLAYRQPFRHCSASKQLEPFQPEPGTMNTYRTESLPFASFLHATRKLRFLGCESANGNGRIAFLFNDPHREGERLQVEFESGAECPAAAFYDSVRHLRRVMDGTRNKGAIEHEHHR